MGESAGIVVMDVLGTYEASIGAGGLNIGIPILLFGLWSNWNCWSLSIYLVFEALLR